MTNNMEWLKKHLLTFYENNSLVTLLEMKIEKLDEGYVEISMPIMLSKHTNINNVAHGGALASLADTIMGVACAAHNKRVVTIEMNMNFIKAAVPQLKIRGIGKVIHAGKSTMVTEGQIIDGQNNLIATARGTFFVTGTFEEVDSEC